MKMGRGVLLDIHRLDRHLPQGDFLFRAIDEHIHLIFEPFPLRGQKPLSQRRRQRPQTGLGIGNLNPAEQPEHLAGDHIAISATKGDVALCKIAAAQHQCLGMGQHLPAASLDILQLMLAVRVYRHHTHAVGIGGQEMIEGRFERPPLAEIDIMPQHLTAVILFRSAEKGVVFRRTAIVDNQYMREASPLEILNQPDHFFVRAQGRNNDQYIGKLLGYILHHVLSPGMALRLTDSEPMAHKTERIATSFLYYNRKPFTIVQKQIKLFIRIPLMYIPICLTLERWSSRCLIPARDAKPFMTALFVRAVKLPLRFSRP